MSFESPQQPTPEKRANIEAERTISDAEFLKEGAKYTFDQKGDRQLEVTSEQVEKTKEEMSDDFLNREHPEKSVSVDGKHLGREMNDFPLHFITSPYPGSDSFTEVHFETVSGNLYTIYKSGDGGLVLADGRASKGKGSFIGSPLTEEDIKNGILKIGKSFTYGKSGTTSEISKIIAVNASRHYYPDDLKQMTEGVSDIRDRVRENMKPEQKK